MCMAVGMKYGCGQHEWGLTVNGVGVTRENRYTLKPLLTKTAATSWLNL